MDALKLTIALDADAAEIAAKLGVTRRTVMAWITGARKPSERNRVALLALVVKAHREHSAAGHRWVASRDRALCQVKLSLQSPAEQAKQAAWSAKIDAQFSAPVPAPAPRAVDPAADLLSYLAANRAYYTAA